MTDELIIEAVKKETRHILRKGANRSRYTLSQAAFRLGISENRIWKDYVETGDLIAHKEKGHFYISDESINRFIEKLENGSHVNSKRLLNLQPGTSK